MSSFAEPTHQTCRNCHRSLPIAKFRRRSKQTGTLDTQCRECHNRDERVRQKQQRLSQSRRQPRQFNTAIAREDDFRAVSAATRALIKHLGGLRGFVRTWQAEYKASKPGSAGRLRALVAIVKMSEAAERAQQEFMDGLSDAELELYRDRLREELLTDIAQ